MLATNVHSDEKFSLCDSQVKLCNSKVTLDVIWTTFNLHCKANDNVVCAAVPIRFPFRFNEAKKLRRHEVCRFWMPFGLSIWKIRFMFYN